jgi:hypothetical protein
VPVLMEGGKKGSDTTLIFVGCGGEKRIKKLE